MPPLSFAAQLSMLVVLFNTFLTVHHVRRQFHHEVHVYQTKKEAHLAVLVPLLDEAVLPVFIIVTNAGLGHAVAVVLLDGWRDNSSKNSSSEECKSAADDEDDQEGRAYP